MEDVRALLLTDVVDSTKLSEELGNQAMAKVWAGHDRLARDLLRVWHGREIDKTDGMLLMFGSPSDAVHYALAYHQALATLPVVLKARAGLHVGPVVLRENSPEDVAHGAKPLEVEGLAKPTAARVMALARGGQTLISDQARKALVEGAWTVQSHGHWMLKGLAEPIELHEIGLDADAFKAPPDGDKAHQVARVGELWLPVRQMPNNLPHQTTSFIGRERERREVRAALEHSRLVTLVGMGGLGKTRLSLQVAVEEMHHFPDGVWFLDLAPIRDDALVISEAAQVLGVREEPDRTVVQSVCAHLKSRRTLLILDNCEHLIQASADLASEILARAPHLHILTSSREALRVPGERAYPILPLPVPSRGDSIEALSRLTAVRLFVARAQQHKPAFVLNEREAPAVAELVTRLEGIPLALELAAARVRSLTVADINARLNDRYKILTGGARVHQERQQTLRALVDWSYDILSEEEQTVLRRLSVFVGGFDMPAAEAVCGDEVLMADDVLDLVSSLVEKSLVMLDERDEGTRYRMLETIRDYAREKLEQSGDLAPTRARHCEHYFVMVKAANLGLQGSEQADWVWRVEAELDNVRAAIALALAGGVDAFIVIKFAVSLMGFWILRGYSTEGRSLVKAALALPAIQASELAQAWGLYVGAALAESQSDYAESLQMLESCLVLRRGFDNPLEVAGTLSTLTPVRLEAGDAAGAEAGQREALQIFAQLGYRVGEAIGLLHLGLISIYHGEVADADAHLENCLAIAREIKNQDVEGECELVLGQNAFESGDVGQAELRFKRSLTVCREGGDKQGEAKALYWLGKTELQGGDVVSARGHLEDALRNFQAYGMRGELLGCLEDHAALACVDGRAGVGARVASAADRARNKLGLRRSRRSEERWQAQLGALRAALPTAEFDAAWGEARPWQIEDAIRAALFAHAQGVRPQ